MFTSIGDKQLVITAVDTAESQFNREDPLSFDVCITCKEESTGESGVWRGEFSNRYGAGKMADKLQRDICMETLRKIGFEGDDLSTLDTLIGKHTSGTVESRVYKEKTYFELKYLGGGSSIKKIDRAEASARLRALMGAATPTAPAQPAEAAPAAKPALRDPFARKA